MKINLNTLSSSQILPKKYHKQHNHLPNKTIIFILLVLITGLIISLSKNATFKANALNSINNSQSHNPQIIKQPIQKAQSTNFTNSATTFYTQKFLTQLQNTNYTQIYQRIFASSSLTKLIHQLGQNYCSTINIQDILKIYSSHTILKETRKILQQNYNIQNNIHIKKKQITIIPTLPSSKRTNTTTTSTTTAPTNYTILSLKTSLLQNNNLFNNTPHTSPSPLSSILIQYQISGYLPYKTITKTTEDLPYGKTKTIQQGINGSFEFVLNKKLNCQTHDLQIISDRLTQFQKPQNKIILKGAPPQYRTITIDGKSIKYYRTLNVWATSYDSSCTGCNNITATGRTLTYGIIAVDPKVIPLHSCIYVPGYGFGQAEDTGGAIKGNKIDLAFENVQNGWWSARYVDIYLVDCKDAQLPWTK